MKEEGEEDSSVVEGGALSEAVAPRAGGGGRRFDPFFLATGCIVTGRCGGLGRDGEACGDAPPAGSGRFGGSEENAELDELSGASRIGEGAGDVVLLGGVSGGWGGRALVGGGMGATRRIVSRLFGGGCCCGLCSGVILPGGAVVRGEGDTEVAEEEEPSAGLIVEVMTRGLGGGVGRLVPEEESEEDSGEESAAGEEEVPPPKLGSVVGWVGAGEEESEGFIVSCWWSRDALIVPEPRMSSTLLAGRGGALLSILPTGVGVSNESMAVVELPRGHFDL